MPITAAEQYFLELLNRARLDPWGEASRQGLALNAGLPQHPFGQISGRPVEVLAPQDNLDRAATGHSEWMASTGRFSHTGLNYSSERDRAVTAGYDLDSSGWRVGENLSLLTGYDSGSEAAMNRHMSNLWSSAIHRSNMMGGADTRSGGSFAYREVGVAEVASGSRDYLTLDLGYAASKVYVTGVAYVDRNSNSFYNIGEAKSGVTFKVGGARDVSESAGGYKVALSPSPTATVDIIGWGIDATVRVGTGQGNVKLDLVNGVRIDVAAHTKLIDGITKAKLLGVANYALSGSDERDLLWGNTGNNRIAGDRMGDKILGMAGNDVLLGQHGNDRLVGGAGRDVLNGGAGRDFLRGDAGADKFVFAKGYGRDTVLDFRPGQGDRLRLDDNLWSGNLTKQQVINRFAEVENGKVVFDFAGVNDLTLNNISSLNGLANAIEIF